MSKRIQIEYSAFLDVLRLMYLLDEYKLDNNATEVLKRLETSLNAKLDSMIKHDLYTQSKIALTAAEREKARIEYLDKIGMHKDYRYNAGFNKNPNFDD